VRLSRLNCLFSVLRSVRRRSRSGIRQISFVRSSETELDREERDDYERKTLAIEKGDGANFTQSMREGGGGSLRNHVPQAALIAV